MAGLALGVKFNATSSGTGDFVYASAVTGYVGPAASNPAMVDGETYRYRAENASLSEWEWGSGVYTASTQTIARTTITLSSTGSKISFTAPPFVGVVPFPPDVLQSANVIINGDFRVNQVAYASAATLSAGTYGHDQWKAGASGGDYSFTQLKSSTQITIASSKSLIQPIEDANVVGGTYILSWTGTAQARSGVNTLTPSGSYASSPLLITGQTAATAMSVEFNTGTLGTVKLEKGTVATPFVMRPFATELFDACRYFDKSYDYATAPGTASVAIGAKGAIAWNTTQLYAAFNFSRRMRVIPTVTLYSYAGTSGKWAKGVDNTDTGAVTVNPISETGMFQLTGAFSSGSGYYGHYIADARL